MLTLTVVLRFRQGRLIKMGRRGQTMFHFGRHMTCAAVLACSLVFAAPVGAADDGMSAGGTLSAFNDPSGTAFVRLNDADMGSVRGAGFFGDFFAALLGITDDDNLVSATINDEDTMTFSGDDPQTFSFSGSGVFVDLCSGGCGTSFSSTSFSSTTNTSTSTISTSAFGSFTSLSF